MMIIAGHNGAGKSTCYRTYLQNDLGQYLQDHIDPDAIERIIRAECAEEKTDDEFADLAQKESNRRRLMYFENRIAFSVETVLSDPVGDKVGFIREAVHRGYLVAVLAVGLDSPEKSRERVALRVSRGGHNVRPDRIAARYPRVISNIKNAVRVASVALVVDNSDDNFDDENGAYYAFSLFVNGENTEVGDFTPLWWK